ncbi:MAG: methyl-accepting chemotaxis protein [Pseudomonadota bacterium]
MAKKMKMRLSDSIYVRVLFLVAFVSVTTTAVLTINAMQVASGVARGVVATLGAEYTFLLAQEGAGALKFGKTDDLQALLDRTVEQLDQKVDTAIVIDANGEIVASTANAGADVGVTRDVAQRALVEGTGTSDEEHLSYAAPVLFGQAEETIGAIAIHWSAGAVQADIAQQKTRSLAYGGAVLTVLLLAISFALKHMIAKPLKAIALAMQDVAEGRYDIEIPQYRRGNEIGVVARALESFRDKVADAAETAKEAAFKGAGFDSSSASLMIADADFNIVYANGSYLDLAKHHQNSMKSSVPAFDLDSVVGSNIDTFHKKPEMQRKMLAALDNDHGAELELGDAVFGLTISPIDGPDGARMGYVVEWKDVTAERRNSAVLETFETRQAMAEFSGDGRMISANDVVASMAGASVSELSGRLISDLVLSESGETMDQIDDAVFGDFQIASASGERSFFVGGLTPIRSKSGEIRRIMLIGSDVSAQRREVQSAKQKQDQMRIEQDRMIEALRGGLAGLSDGDLTVRLDDPFSEDHDQLRHDFNGALGRLSETMSSVATRSTAIRGDVADISSAADDLSRRTEHQAATLEETAAALTELTASVNSAAEGARKANEVVLEARSNAEKSGGVVRDAVDAMGMIAESSSKISSIISVIDDIAFQTNLLALNAGVEAARAGDAGRGFAVVASEVRALAQRSSEAAREINALISASGEHVNQGVTLVGDAGSALERIVSSVSDITEHVSSIAASAQEQSTGLAEINDAMNQLDQVTQQNAAMFEETTAAAQALSTAGIELSDTVAKFKLNDKPSAPRTERPVQSDRPREPMLATGTDAQFTVENEANLDSDWTDF